MSKDNSEDDLNIPVLTDVIKTREDEEQSSAN